MAGTKTDSTGVTFPDATSQTTARTASNTVTSFNGSVGAVSYTPVTSAVAGNGIAVSAATGAVTFSVAAPSFNSVGSYCWVGVQGSTSVVITLTSGTNYAVGTGTSQVQSSSGSSVLTNNLSGTWKWMGGTATIPFCSCVNRVLGIAVRVA